ncbi:MAG: amino acid-binding protein [Bacteroidales bacterium]|nr:amino acid-binding protein [Bacteroidales bacterium]
MTINQLSIFLENRSGTLTKVLDILKETGIQIIASTIADTAQYGILRIICSEPRRAYNELEKGGVAVALSDVFAIELDNKPGQAADTIKLFSDQDISIIYMYSFLFHGKGILIFRTDNTDEAREVILKAHLHSVAEGELSDWE